MHAHPLSAYYHHVRYKVAVYAPAERADTLLLFHLYPIWYVGCRYNVATNLQHYREAYSCDDTVPGYRIFRGLCLAGVEGESVPLFAQLILRWNVVTV